MKNYKEFLALKEKIKKYAEGGQVQETQQEQYQAKDYFGKGSNVGNSPSTSNSQGIRMSQGGWSELADKIKEAFHTPIEKPKEETQEEKYARIRKENQERAMGKRPSLQSMDDEAQKRGYSKGGDVSTSANTASNLSPLLKETYGKYLKKKHKYANGGSVNMDLGDIPITPSTPYPGEEEEAQDVTSASTSGQIQKLIDEALAQDQGQTLPPTPSTPEEEPYLKPMTEDGDYQNQALEAKYAKDNARNLEGITLNKDEALKESGLDLESQYAKEDADALKASDSSTAAQLAKEDTGPEAIKAPEQKIPEGESIPPFDPITALKNAQEGRDKSQMFNQLGAIAERGAAGWAGIKPTQQETFKENMVIAQQAVDDVKDRIKQQGDDPNSIVSKNFRQYLEKFSGQPVDPRTTANSGKEILPMVFKDYEAKEASKTRKALMEDRNRERIQQAEMLDKQRRDISKENIDMKKYLANLAHEGRQSEHALKVEEKQDQFDRKRLDDLGKKLTAETASSRSSFGRAANNIRAAEAIEALVEQSHGDLNSLDSRQVYELSKSLDGLLSAGQSTISGTEHLIPHTYRGNISKIAEMITNTPKGAQQGDFIKRTVETVKREKQIAKDQIKSAQGKILGPYKETLRRRPEDARDILAPHGLDFMLDEQPSESKSEKASESKAKKVVKKGYNAKTNQTQLIYDDGSKEIVDGRK